MKTEAPPIRAFQFNEGGEIDFDSSVNQFRGDVNLTLPLLSIAARRGDDGPEFALTLSYQGHIQEEVKAWNRDQPTGILGTGWHLPVEHIELLTPGAGLHNRVYSLKTDTGENKLIFTGETRNGAHVFESDPYQFWEILFYPETEKWTITRENGHTAVYGGECEISGEGFRSSTGNSVCWGVAWGGGAGAWSGSSGVTEGQRQYARKWYLSRIQDTWGESIEFEYNGFERNPDGLIHDVEQFVGDKTGKPYTKACYLTGIRDSVGHTLRLNYKDKLYSQNPEAVREYEDAHKVLRGEAEGQVPANLTEPNAYQDQYETKYLDSIQVDNTRGQKLFSLLFDYYAPVSVIPGTARQKGDTARRYLKSVNRRLADGALLAGFAFEYYHVEDEAQHRGALKSVRTSQGAVARYTYAKKSLDVCTRRIHLDKPDAASGWIPRIWFGQDYTVATWFNPEKNLFRVFACTWIGRWHTEELSVEFLPGDRFHHDSLEVIAADSFFVLSFSDGLKASRVYAFHKNAHFNGQWTRPETLTLNSKETRCAIGEDFVLVHAFDPAAGLHRLSRITWLRREKRWRLEQDFLESANTPFMNPGDRLYLLLEYDRNAGRKSRLSLWYLGSDETWRQGDQRDLDLRLLPQGASFDFSWAAGRSMAAATYKTISHPGRYFDYAVLLVRWDQAYRFESLTSHDFRQVLNQTAERPYQARIFNDSFVGCGEHLLRFNGRTWQSNSELSTDNPARGVLYWMAYGEDYAIKTTNSVTRITRELLAFDPDADSATWKRKSIHPLPTPVVPGTGRETSYFPGARDADFFISGNDVYFRGSSTDWVSSVKTPVHTIGDRIDSTLLVNQAPHFISYEVPDAANPALTRTDVLYLHNGAVSKTESLPGETCNPRISAVSGSHPAGPGMFVTYPARDGSFNRASQLFLHRFAGESSITEAVPHYVVEKLTVDAGYGNVYQNHYEFDSETAAADPSGIVAKYYQSSMNKKDSAGTALGRTTYEFINGYAWPEELPDPSDHFQILDGLLHRKKIYDDQGSLIVSEKNTWQAFLQRGTTPKGSEVKELYGSFIRRTGHAETLDGISRKACIAFMADGQKAPYSGLPVSETTSFFDSRGEQVTLEEHKQYGYEHYPALLNAHMLTSLVSHVKIRRRGEGPRTLSAVVTTWKDWGEKSSGDAKWAAHKTYVYDRTPGKERFDFAAWSDAGEPDQGWFKKNEILNVNEFGQILEDRDQDLRYHSILFDRSRRAIVASFAGARLSGNEAAYYGFEEYEEPQGWRITAPDDPERTIAMRDCLCESDCYTGQRALRLPAFAEGPLNLENRFCPENTDQVFWLGFYAKTGIDFAGAETGCEITLRGENDARSRFVPIVNTGGVWKYITTLIDPQDFGLADFFEIAFRFYNRDKDHAVLLDSILYSPSRASCQMNVYDDSPMELPVAELDMAGGVVQMVYDPFTRPAANIGEQGCPIDLSAESIWRESGEIAEPENQPVSFVRIEALGEGVFDNFRRGEEWRSRWVTTGAWQVERGMLRSPVDGGRLAIKLPEFQENYGLRFALEFDEGSQNVPEILLPEQFRIRYHQSRWELLDLTAGDAVLCAVNRVASVDARDWLLLMLPRRVLFFVNGELLLQGIFARTLRGSLELHTKTSASIDHLIVFQKPRVSLSYLDRMGRPIQNLAVIDTVHVQTATLYDSIGREAVQSYPVEYRNEGIALRENLIETFDWFSGVMTGEVSDFYPETEQYPYTRSSFENRQGGRLLESARGGRVFGMDLRVPVTERHTTRLRYETNQSEEMFPDLPAGEYFIERSIDGNQNYTSALRDSAGNTVATWFGDLNDFSESTGLTRHFYDGYGEVELVQLPNYFESDRSGRENFVVEMKYDFRGNVIRKKVPEARSEIRYIYDRGDRLRFMLDPTGAGKGYFIYHCFDAVGRPIEAGLCYAEWDESFLQSHADQSDWLPAGAVWFTRYEYGDGADVNSLGRLVRSCVNQNHENPGAEVEELFEYDARGRVRRKTLRLSRLREKELSVAINYDNAGNTRELTYSHADAPDFHIRYEYDCAGRMISVSGASAAAPGSSGADEEFAECARYVYLPDGRINTELLDPGGAAIKRTYDYHPAGFLRSCGDRFFREELSYTEGGYEGAADFTGKISRAAYRRETPPADIFGVPASYHYEYAYEDSDRIAVAKHSLSPQWSLGVATPLAYDSNSNTLRISRGQDVQNFSYAEDSDRLLSTAADGQVEFQYDDMGQTVAALAPGISGIEHHPISGRTMRMKIEDSGADRSLWYNGESHRVLQIQGDESRVYFTGPGGQVAFEVHEAAGAVNTEYHIHGPTGIVCIRSGSQSRYLLKDHLQSTRAIVQAGRLIAAYDYDPLGNMISDAGGQAAGTRPTRRLFMGYELDESTGLYNAGSRFYDPHTGRFYGVDPAGQYASPYVYGGGDWINFLDPDGEFAWESFGIGLGMLLLGGAVAASGAGIPALAFLGGGISSILHGVSSEKMEWDIWGAEVAFGVASGAASGALGYGVAAVAGKLFSGSSSAARMAAVAGIGAPAQGGLAVAETELFNQALRDRNSDSSELWAAFAIGAAGGLLTSGMGGAWAVKRGLKREFAESSKLVGKGPDFRAFVNEYRMLYHFSDRRVHGTFAAAAGASQNNQILVIAGHGSARAIRGHGGILTVGPLSTSLAGTQAKGVVLLGCNTGTGPNPLARQLARKMKVPVMGFTDTITPEGIKKGEFLEKSRMFFPLGPFGI